MDNSLSESARFAVYREKLKGICEANNLSYVFIKNAYPIKLVIRPLGGVGEQMSMLEEASEDNYISPGASILFTVKDGNLTYRMSKTFTISDTLFNKIKNIFKNIPKEQIVTKRYEKENAERKNHLQDLQTQRNKAEKDLLALKTEVLACIKGESVLPRETLAEMITAQEEKLTELENLCEAASEELEKTAELMDKVSRLYDELISYADLYDSANFEAKKMIVNQLIRRVDVYRGYQINISFNFDLTPYIEGE